ncbi:MAG TPA: hypothetical protein VLX91_02240 [Candidatus Acidoferrales bacterium]|nr:hypothetical protein [Candidatus Acidoferrales bacterium]
MLEYEESRTEDVVRRLITISKIIRFIIIIVFTFIFLGLFAMVWKDSGNVTIIMALVGGVGGYVIGKYTAALITVMVEWYAQMLVGVENALNLLKKK